MKEVKISFETEKKSKFVVFVQGSSKIRIRADRLIPILMSVVRWYSEETGDDYMLLKVME